MNPTRTLRIRVFSTVLGLVAFILSACSSPGTPVGITVFRPGTFNLAVRDAPATAFFVRLSETLDTSATFTVTGPAGWNEGEPAAFTRTREDLQDQNTVLYLGAEAQTGTYTLNVSTPNGSTTRTATLEPLDLLPVPQNVMVTASSSASVSATWDAVAGAASYEMLIREPPVSFSSRVIKSVFVEGSSATLTGLALPAGDYAVEVSAYPLDFARGAPTAAPNFNISYTISEPFTVE